MSALSSATSTRAGRARPAGADGSVSLPSGTGRAPMAPPSCAVPGSQRRASWTNGSANGSALAETVAAWPAGTRAPARKWACPKGRLMVNVVPVPSVLDAAMVPPCSWTSSWTRARPMPLPSFERERVFSMR